ncbi:MAG: hypothetical protein HUJ73_06665, partial [Eubacterium sp.]|nr:hypothetical protein [Eubacterium sp.]
MSTSEETPYFEEILPKLVIKESSFSDRIPAGESRRYSCVFCAENGTEVNGRLTTDNRRILLAADSFSGTECELLFGVDTVGLEPGEKIEGRIHILCNLGEYSVSVSSVITDAEEKGFDPKVNALEDFQSVCSKNMREGFRLFTHPAFSHILNGKNVVYLPLYKGLSHNPVTYQHLEEFLISTGKKEPVKLSLDKQKKAVYHLNGSQKDTL